MLQVSSLYLGDNNAGPGTRSQIEGRGGFPQGSVLVMVTDYAGEEEAGELRSGPDLGHSGITN